MFLLVTSSLVLLSIVVFLPETVRTIAGDGTRQLSGIYQPLLRRFLEEPAFIKTAQDEESPTPPKVTLGTFLQPIKLLIQRDIFVSLLFGGIVYAIWSIVVATTTPLFKERFELNELLLGLVFLPNGTSLYIDESKSVLTTESRSRHHCRLRNRRQGHDSLLYQIREIVPRQTS